MLRQLLFAFIIALSQPMILAANESEEGNCTILNTADHPIVIGLYQPTEDGISEQLVEVAPKTQIMNVPVQLVADAQFVIAYEASLRDNPILRSKPVAIVGHTLLKYMKKKSESEMPDVMIQYRGGSSIAQRSRPDPFNTALYVPGTESEAKRILREANHTSQLIETPLAQQDYSEVAEP